MNNLNKIKKQEAVNNLSAISNCEKIIFSSQQTELDKPAISSKPIARRSNLPYSLCDWFYSMDSTRLINLLPKYPIFSNNQPTSPPQNIAPRNQLQTFDSHLSSDLHGVQDMVSQPAIVKVKEKPIKNNSTVVKIFQIVVLWPGAEHTPHNIRIARSRTAILESGGNVKEAQELLSKEGNGIALSTLYGHIKILNEIDLEWNSGIISKQLGNLENGVSPRTKGKQRGS